jgi:5-methylcytosine-specific restriction protein A
MEFRGGNRAIRDHADNGKDLHLFESLGKGKGYRYVGMFTCASWEYRQGVDLKRDERRVIIFHLIQPGAEEEQELSPPDVSLDQLRQGALKAASQAEESRPQQAKTLYHKRSAAVRDYVLARAGGVCECCGKPAPFLRINGTPYLEPHHTRRISDGGPDHPRWVAAICPNCHREVHHGKDQVEKNQHLQHYLALLEE